MAISGVATSTSVPSGNGATSSSPVAPTVDYNQFLKLLVAELRNQDPTSPTDPTQYMSQLASFSSVGQQVQTNATLEALLSAQASTVIGKTLISSDGTISGTVVSVEIASGGGAVATLSDGRHITLGAGVTVSSS